MSGPSTSHRAQHIEGFEAPIHGSLGSPILLGGAPRGLAIVNGTLAAAKVPLTIARPRGAPPNNMGEARLAWIGTSKPSIALMRPTPRRRN